MKKSSDRATKNCYGSAIRDAAATNGYATTARGATRTTKRHK